MKILITPTSFGKPENAQAKQKIEAFADEVVYNPHGRPLTGDELPALLCGVDGYIAGLDSITAAVIQGAPESLKVISRYGAGVDRVDIPAARERGIVVTNTAGHQRGGSVRAGDGTDVLAGTAYPCAGRRGEGRAVAAQQRRGALRQNARHRRLWRDRQEFGGARARAGHDRGRVRSVLRRRVRRGERGDGHAAKGAAAHGRFCIAARAADAADAAHDRCGGDCGHEGTARSSSTPRAAG